MCTLTGCCTLQVQLQPPAPGELRFAVAESRNPVLSRAVSECVQVRQLEHICNASSVNFEVHCSTSDVGVVPH